MSNRKSKDSWEPDWKFGLDDPTKLSANMLVGWCAVWGMYFRKWIKDCDIDLNVLISKLGLEGKVDVWLDVFNGRRILAAREMIKIEDLQFKPKNWKPLEVIKYNDPEKFRGIPRNQSEYGICKDDNRNSVFIPDFEADNR